MPFIWKILHTFYFSYYFWRYSLFFLEILMIRDLLVSSLAWLKQEWGLEKFVFFFFFFFFFFLNVPSPFFTRQKYEGQSCHFCTRHVVLSCSTYLPSTIIIYSKGYSSYRVDTKSISNKTKGNNSKNKKARVVILVRDTSSSLVLHFYLPSIINIF